MKIMFVANHGPHDNQDEDAITFSLTKLGHEVITVEEKWRKRHIQIDRIDADVCLFLKWENVPEMVGVARRMPMVGWYFDLVASEDQSLKRRMEFRREWFSRVLPLCKLMFCTDGDWVSLDNTGKLRWLMQGMDERVAGYGIPLPEPQPPILFTGTPHHGAKREEHIQQLRDRYGKDFQVLGEGGPNRRVHGRALADLFASVRVVVAPDGPCTDHYWSNRVYLTTGLGGFLLHPFCEGLYKQYGNNLLYYNDRKNLMDTIDFYISDDPIAAKMLPIMRGYGQRATMLMHTYTHRCEQLMKMVRGVL